MENIIERLGVQSVAFQESFDVLSRSKTLQQLAEKFFQILRGNILVVNAGVFFKADEAGEWQTLFLKLKKSAGPIDQFINQLNGPGIRPVEHPEIKMAITHTFIDKSKVGIVLGSKLDGSEYTSLDTIILQFYLQQLDSAYQFYKSRKKEKQLIFSLNHRVLQLNSLVDTGIEVARLQAGTTLLHLSLERVLALTNASKAMLKVKKGREVVEKIFFPAPFKAKNLQQGKHHISATFTFGDKKYHFHLFEKESRNGIIQFDATDQLLLEAFARQVHVSLENHYLLEQSLEKERVDQEIELAGDIQKKLIPEVLPQIDGFDQCGINIPTKYIGGDFYDCIPLTDGRFLFIMADVSGKGVAAGLLVSTLHASVHALIESSFELAGLVQKLNEIIFDSSTIEKYITAFFILLDPEKGTIESVNAGHNHSYILRTDKTVDELKTGGIPLGMMRMAFPYESVSSDLYPGDRLLMYTDGVTEAMNEREEEYDDIRPLKQFFKTNTSQTAGNFIADLIADVQDFTGQTPQSDDITALCIFRAK